MPKIPTKQEAAYLLEMLRSGLIDYSYTNPWAEELILENGEAPQWLWDLTVKKHQGDQLKALTSYVYSEPLDEMPIDIGKFYLACLWQRHLRRELSWATFLKQVGQYLDGTGCEEPWDCETPYHYLNMVEDANFTREIESTTKDRYFKEQDFRSLSPKVDAYLRMFPAEKRLRKAREE